MTISTLQVETALKELIDPNTGKDFVAAKSAKNIKVDGDDVAVDVVLGYPAKSQIDGIRRQVIEKLKAHRRAWATSAPTSRSKIVSHAVQRGVKLIHGVKNIIAVASGKGGVGKSTTAVNLALALAAEGAKRRHAGCRHLRPVAAHHAGHLGQPESQDGKTMEPMEGHGLQAMSIGFLIEADTPMVWRGPMVTQALEQLLTRDPLGGPRLPGGRPAARHRRHPAHAGAEGAGDRRGDRHHAAGHRAAGCAQGPQDVREGRHPDPRHRGEHEHAHLLPSADTKSTSSARAAAQRMCADYEVEFLGALPLDIAIREQTDSGKPTVVADPDGRVAQIYKQIARRVAVKVAEQAQDISAAFPKIVMQNT